MSSETDAGPARIGTFDTVTAVTPALPEARLRGKNRRVRSNE
jgi:hypothetical protein